MHSFPLATSSKGELSLLREWLQPFTNDEEDLCYHLRKAAPGTCEWAFDSSDPVGSQIFAWLNGSGGQGSFVWITANPGQGKSVLAAKLVNHCEDTQLPHLYFFCRRDDIRKYSTLSILRTTAFKLATIDPNTRQQYLKMRDGGVSAMDMGVYTMWKTLIWKSFNSLTHKPLWWVIDGFDEIPSPEQDTLARLLPEVRRLAGKVRLLVVGRPDRHVREIFEDADPPRIEAIQISAKSTAADIHRVISAKVEQRCDDLAAEFRCYLIKTLSEKAGCLFLWARLALGMICNTPLENDIHEVLDNMPASQQMEDMYKHIMSRMSLDFKKRQLVNSLLIWTLYSHRPLSIAEIRYAVETELGPVRAFERTIREYTGFLVDYDENQLVRTIHRTVNEFFETDSAGDFKTSKAAANEKIFQVCMGSITSLSDILLHTSDDSEPEPDRLRRDYPLLEYSAEYMFSHAPSSQNTRIPKFLESSYCLTWMEALGAFGKAHVLSDAAEVIKKNLDISTDPDVKAQLTRLSFDLQRIALHAGESINRYPRSIHHSLSSYFPLECTIGRERPYSKVKCLSPLRYTWSPIRATRKVYLEGKDTQQSKSAYCFTPSGDYLIHACLILESEDMTLNHSLEVVVYESRTYRRVSSESLSLNEIKVDIVWAGVPIVCCSYEEDSFQVVVVFALYHYDNKNDIVVCGLSSNSPYESGIWKMVRHENFFDATLSIETLRHKLCLRSKSQGILLLLDTGALYFCSDLSVARLESRIPYISPIVDAAFMINAADKMVCIGQRIEGYSIYVIDLEGTLWSETALEMRVLADTVYIDRLTYRILFWNDYEMDIVTCSSDWAPISNSCPELQAVVSYKGEVESTDFNYVVWNTGGTRYCIYSLQPVAIHPCKPESLVERSPSSFIIINDCSFQISDSSVRLSSDSLKWAEHIFIVSEGQLNKWQEIVDKSRLPEHRIKLYMRNFTISSCGKVAAFTGCNKVLHGLNACNCYSSRSRIGIGDLGKEECDLKWLAYKYPGILFMGFDIYTRLCIIAGGSLEIVDPSTGFMLYHISSLHVGYNNNLSVHALSYSEYQVVAWSQAEGVEILQCDTTSSQVARRYIMKEDNIVAVAYVKNGLVLFIDRDGWVGMLRFGEAIHWLVILPEEISGDSVVDIKCSEDGLLELLIPGPDGSISRALDGRVCWAPGARIWKFEVISIMDFKDGRTLESKEFNMNRFKNAEPQEGREFTSLDFMTWIFHENCEVATGRHRRPGR